VLIVKKNLLQTIYIRMPHNSRRRLSVLLFVTETHQHSGTSVTAEEASTPNVIGNIRIELVVHLKLVVNSALKSD
jgi:hypothetical protein